MAFTVSKTPGVVLPTATPYNEDIIKLVSVLRPPQFATYRERGQSSREVAGPHKMFDAIPFEEDVEAGWNIGITSKSPTAADARHMFMADVDELPNGLVTLAALDPMYTIVESSFLKYHLYGPLMTWEAMLNLWEQFKLIGCIDQGWVKMQKDRGFATLRISGRLGVGSTPDIIGKVEALQKIEGPMLHALCRRKKHNHT